MIVRLPKGTHMNKSIFALVLATAVTASSLAWCETKTFQVSVTIPATAYLAAQAAQQNPSADQTAQTERLFRGNQTISVTSIVVP